VRRPGRPVTVTAVYLRVEAWGRGGLDPYGFAVWRPHGVEPTPGVPLGRATLHNATLSRDRGSVRERPTHALEVLRVLVRLGGGPARVVYAPLRDLSAGSSEGRGSVL